MAAISETLRQARLRSGVDLNRLAAKTKINPRYLEAIETGEFDKLPSGIFARMFIKQYADAVGLDGATFADEFQRSSHPGGHSGGELRTAAEPRGHFHPTVPSVFSTGEKVRNERLASTLSSLIWVLLVILVCAGAYYGLAHLPPRHSAGTEQPSSTPTPVTPAPNAKEKTPPAVQAPPVAPVAAPVTPSAPPPSSSPIRVELSATDPCWVTATADGKTVIAEVMQPGSVKAFDAANGARIRLGNAGGMNITFNGKKLDPFGPKGQPRTVDFTSWGAQVVSPAPVPTAQPPGAGANPDPLR